MSDSGEPFPTAPADAAREQQFAAREQHDAAREQQFAAREQQFAAREQQFAAREQRLAALRPWVEGRSIAVGVCAGIASYKICSVVSALAQCGATVTVAMTTDAQRFVTPLVFQSLSGRAVIGSPWESASPADPQHIRTASALDLLLIAPCTMDMLARLASGRCDDAVSLLAASIDRARTPVLVAPSMNEAMWRQPATQRNLATLRDDGFAVLDPACGWQACRAVGPGRLPEPDELLDAVAAELRGRAGR